jgi:hypothetical protein
LKKNKILWFLPILIVIGSYLLFLIYLTYPISEFNIEKAGQIGDSFGILNSLFSGFAFVALIMTIYLQQEEINNMKKELEKQNFENIFFLILEKFNTKQNNDLKSFDKQFENRYQKFEEMRYKLYEYYKYYNSQFPQEESVKSIEAYFGVYNEPHFNLKIYFENLFFIIDFINNSKLTYEIKKIYYKLLINDLTYNELIMMFYHVLSKDKFLKYKYIMEEESFFEGISHKSLIKECKDLLEYNISAYGKNEALISVYNHCKKEMSSIK